ncbi:dapper homolog 3-like isoform X2 [Dendropsophus ebraccatus]|uniref:dapper homolog 3-like isoform X2 n=1 Tax=Dendropsophus ebraccatus TaxID=150705 RepID=UPI0038318DEC
MLGSGSSVDRGRLRQLLRGSVAGLCELKLLRERQEVRVRRALRGGEDLDRQLWELERQLGELRLRAEHDQENAEYDADGPESCDVFVDRAPRVGQAEARMQYASERPKSAGVHTPSPSSEWNNKETSVRSSPPSLRGQSLWRRRPGHLPEPEEAAGSLHCPPAPLQTQDTECQTIWPKSLKLEKTWSS